MISTSDTVMAPLGGATNHVPPQDDPLPANWREALMSLIATRLSLIELEAKDAAKQAATRGAALVGAFAFIIFAWLLLLAGGVSLIAKSANLPWDLVAIGLAAIHFLGGIIFARLARPSSATAFPVTRTEFKKDREWIENFQKTKK